MSERRWEPHRAAEGVVIYQPRPGYRFAADPVLLAGWIAEQGVPETILDVGTGSGVLGLLLAGRGAKVTGLDVQGEWQEWAERSASESGLAESYQFVRADIRDWKGARYDLCVCNPPYFTARQGHLPADPMRAAARHALFGELDALIAAMATLAPRVALVLPMQRLEEARSALRQAGLSVVRSLELLPRLGLIEGGSTHQPEQTERSALRWKGDHHPRVRALYRAVAAPLAVIPSVDGAPNAIGGGDGDGPQEAGGAQMDPTNPQRQERSGAFATGR